MNKGMLQTNISSDQMKELDVEFEKIIGELWGHISDPETKLLCGVIQQEKVRNYAFVIFVNHPQLLRDALYGNVKAVSAFKFLMANPHTLVHLSSGLSKEDKDCWQLFMGELVFYERFDILAYILFLFNFHCGEVIEKFKQVQKRTISRTVFYMELRTLIGLTD